NTVGWKLQSVGKYNGARRAPVLGWYGARGLRCQGGTGVRGYGGMGLRGTGCWGTEMWGCGSTEVRRYAPLRLYTPFLPRSGVAPGARIAQPGVDAIREPCLPQDHSHCLANGQALWTGVFAGLKRRLRSRSVLRELGG